MKKLPIGVQDYREIVEENYVYVDKTKYLYDLMTSGKFYFFITTKEVWEEFNDIDVVLHIQRGERTFQRNIHIRQVGF
nr:AAA family ATPase [Thermosipho melanesiensis]